MAIVTYIGKESSAHTERRLAELREEGVELFTTTSSLVTTDEGKLETCWMTRKYTGRVISTGEINGRDDSDFYAVIWDPETKSTFRDTYASTRGWTYLNNATVDLTPEYRADYEAYEAAREEAATVKRHRLQALGVINQSMRPKVGSFVTVVKGRKVPKGTTGKVTWAGTCQYSGKMRIGIKDDSGEVQYTAASNVEVGGPISGRLTKLEKRILGYLPEEELAKVVNHPYCGVLKGSDLETAFAYLEG